MNTCRCGVSTPRKQCYFCARTHWSRRPVCGAVMPTYGDRCARRLGHADPADHRSKYALENARLMRTGRGLRELIAA